jgi:predicted acylesterase/phospholipase RssA/CRP-like cAMP-binding protein
MVSSTHAPARDRKDEGIPAVVVFPSFRDGRGTCDAASMSGTDRTQELGAFLAGIPFFASFDQSTLVWLARQLEPVHAQAGDTVIAEGDPGDGLYVLLSGRLRVSITAAPSGTERVLHDLGRGAVIGEIALLSDRPRSATVRAVRDSDLLLLRTASFKALIEQNPGFLAQMARLLIERLLAVDRPQPHPGNRAIAVAPAGPDPTRATAIADALAEQLQRAGTTARLDSAEVDRRLGPGAAERGPDHPRRHEVTGWLDTVERGHDHVVYLTDPDDSEWSRLCLSQSDVVLLAGGGTDHRLGAVEARALAATWLRCELVLTHRSRPGGTARWLAERPVADYHHVRDGRPGDTARDVARLARMVTGTACGVVLGGGGPRGFAHLGVLHALETAGVPVDVIGGTSIGAVMGALCAQDLPHAERVERALRAFTRSGPLMSPTLPLVALSSGNRVDRLLAEHFGGMSIENLPVRFFCVSANLTRAEEVVHERGVLWRAIRASLSLPGIFPPVYSDGDLLIDGGALDNVPTEVMRARVGGGTVIAVDISPAVEPMTVAPFGPGLSGWQVLADRLNPLSPRRPVPTVFDIVSRANGLSGTRHQRVTLGGEHVDLLLHPPVPAIGAYDFKAGAALIETGYRHAAEALAASGLPGRFR